MKNTSRKKSIYADLSLLLVAILWGGGFVATKNALDNITPYYMMTIRFSIAFFLLTCIFWKKIKKLNKEDIKAGIIVGFFLFTAFAAQTVGLQYTTPGKQAFLTGTNVVIVPFLYWMVSKKRIDRYAVGASILCLIGIGMLSLEGGLYVNLGDMLTLVCAVLFAAHIVSVGYFAERVDPFVLAALQMGVAAIFSGIIAFSMAPRPEAFTLEGIKAVLYLGVFSTCIAFLIQNVAQKYTNATHTAIILCMESVFGSVFSMLILGEKFTLRMVLGCMIIFIAILTSETKWSFLTGKKKALSE